VVRHGGGTLLPSGVRPYARPAQCPHTPILPPANVEWVEPLSVKGTCCCACAARPLGRGGAARLQEDAQAALHHDEDARLAAVARAEQRLVRPHLDLRGAPPRPASAARECCDADRKVLTSRAPDRRTAARASPMQSPGPWACGPGRAWANTCAGKPGSAGHAARGGGGRAICVDSNSSCDSMRSRHAKNLVDAKKLGSSDELRGRARQSLRGPRLQAHSRVMPRVATQMRGGQVRACAGRLAGVAASDGQEPY